MNTALNTIPTNNGWSPFQAEIIYKNENLLFGRYKKFIHKSLNIVTPGSSMFDHYRAVERLLKNPEVFESATIWDNRVNRQNPVVISMIQNQIVLDNRICLDFLEHNFSYTYLKKLAESFDKPIEQDKIDLERLMVNEWDFYTKNI